MTRPAGGWQYPREDYGSAVPGVLPAGGATGQVPKKNSATDYDYSWADDLTGSGGSGGGGGAMVPLFDSTLSAAAANIPITIPAGYRDLVIIFSGRGDKAAFSMEVRLRFNGDTGSNYDRETNYLNQSNDADVEAAASTYLMLGIVPAASTTSGVQGGLEVRVLNYAGTTFNKSIFGMGTAPIPNSGPGFYVYNNLFGGQWRSASAITSALLYPDSGNFIAGTRVTVWGIAASGVIGVGAEGATWDPALLPTDASVQTARTTNFADTTASITGFTWINQGTATAAIQRKRLVMTAPTGSTGTVASRILKPASGQQLPATPWCVQVPVTLYGTDNYNMAGIVIRNASNSKLYNPGIVFRRDAGTGYFFCANRLTNESTYASDALGPDAADGSGVIAVGCDGTNISFWYSKDGREWPTTPNFTETLAAFLGAGGSYEFGFMVESRAADQATGAFNNAIILNQATPVPHGQFINTSPRASSPDDAPVVANAMDDECTGTSLNPIWTIYDPGGITGSVTKSYGTNGWMSFSCPSSVQNRSFGILQAAPAGNWRVRSKVAFDSATLSYFGFGLVARKSGSPNKYSWAGAMYHQSFGTPTCYQQHDNDNTSVSETDLYDFRQDTFYLEMEYDGTNLTWRISKTGAYYTRFWQESAASYLGAAPTEIGFHFHFWGDTSDANHIMVASIDWFRRVA